MTVKVSNEHQYWQHCCEGEGGHVRLDIWGSQSVASSSSEG